MYYPISFPFTIEVIHRSFNLHPTRLHDAFVVGVVCVSTVVNPTDLHRAVVVVEEIPVRLMIYPAGLSNAVIAEIVGFPFNFQHTCLHDAFVVGIVRVSAIVNPADLHYAVVKVKEILV